MKQKIVVLGIISMIFVFNLQSIAQSDALSHSRNSTHYLGWNNLGTSGSLDIKNDFTSNAPINFFTNNGSQRATILTNGNFGIGTTAPGVLFEVKGSSDATQVRIIANSTQSNTNPLLAFQNSSGTNVLTLHSDNASNCFIGVYSAQNNAVGAGLNGQLNTFVGGYAGYSNTSGSNNIALGYKSLYACTTGTYNSAIGNYSLYSTTSGGSNSAVGYASLYSNNGAGNSALGYYSLSLLIQLDLKTQH